MYSETAGGQAPQGVGRAPSEAQAVPRIAVGDLGDGTPGRPDPRGRKGARGMRPKNNKKSDLHSCILLYEIHIQRASFIFAFLNACS
jgi:hypothetical protein